MMISIDTKRVYAPFSPDDGTRILVDRLWPRGVRKDRAFIDFWIKDAAPSPSLRIWFDHRADRFSVFKERYEAELRSGPGVVELLKAIGGRKATLLYGAHDTKVNHAVVLAAFLVRLHKGTGNLS